LVNETGGTSGHARAKELEDLFFISLGPRPPLAGKKKEKEKNSVDGQRVFQFDYIKT
jgi:hypothetical protein